MIFCTYILYFIFYRSFYFQKFFELKRKFVQSIMLNKLQIHIYGSSLLWNTSINLFLVRKPFYMFIRVLLCFKYLFTYLTYEWTFIGTPHRVWCQWIDWRHLLYFKMYHSSNGIWLNFIWYTTFCNAYCIYINIYNGNESQTHHSLNRWTIFSIAQNCFLHPIHKILRIRCSVEKNSGIKLLHTLIH